MGKIIQADQLVIRYLKKTARRQYLLRWAGLVFAMAVVSQTVVYIGGKWAFFNPPHGHPVVLFHLTSLIVALGIVRLFFWRGICQPPTTWQIARHIEKRNPALHESLTATLEFSQPDPVLETSLAGSKNLLQGFYQQTYQNLTGCSRWKETTPTVFWCWLVLFLGCSMFWWQMPRFEPFTGDDAWNLYRRNLLTNPYRDLYKLIVEPGFSEVLQGDEIKVSAMLLGPGSHSAQITYHMQGFPEQVVEMNTTTEQLNHFEFLFKNLQSTLVYQIESGPLKSPEYTVDVRVPAELTHIQLTYFYPSFMQRSVEVVPEGQAAVMAPKGTTLEISTQWSQPMEKLFLTVNNSEAGPMWPSGTYWKGRFTIDGAGRYIFSGTNTQGVPLRDNIEFSIQELVDLSPEIEWVWPDQDMDFSVERPDHPLVLRFKASDDFGLDSISLLAGSPGLATQTFKIVQLDGKEREVEGEHLFNPRFWFQLPVCRLKLVAIDNHPGFAGTGQTATRRLYFQPPGSFSEIEDSTEDLVALMSEPYELTAIRVYHLWRVQQEQNGKYSVDLSGENQQTWLERQNKSIKLVSRTALEAREASLQLRRGVNLDNPNQDQRTNAPVKKGNPEWGKDLPNRLEAVARRLIGENFSLDGGNVDRQAVYSLLEHQTRAAAAGLERRTIDEGKQAVEQLAIAYRELTGKEPPVLVDPDDLEEPNEDNERADDNDEDKKKPGDEDAEKESATDQEPLPTDGISLEEDLIVSGVEVEGGGTPMGEDMSKGGMNAPSDPTNLYKPSAFTLDPSTVQISTRRDVLLNKAAASILHGEQWQQDERVPPEYQDAVQEFKNILMDQ